MHMYRLVQGRVADVVGRAVLALAHAEAIVAVVRHRGGALCHHLEGGDADIAFRAVAQRDADPPHRCLKRREAELAEAEAAMGKAILCLPVHAPCRVGR